MSDHPEIDRDEAVQLAHAWKAEAEKQELRADRAEAKAKAAASRAHAADMQHQVAFNAGAHSGHNHAYQQVAEGLERHADRLAGTGGIVEQACARVLRKAASNIRHHIVPIRHAHADTEQESS